MIARIVGPLLGLSVLVGGSLMATGGGARAAGNITRFVPAIEVAGKSSPAPSPTPGNCSPSYPGVCIPPPPPDLDCGDISFRNFAVLPPDPHDFDTDNDGIGCET